MDTFVAGDEKTTINHESGAAIISDLHHRSEGPGPAVMDAATLNGDSVVDGAGENLGTIEAIMLDVGSGRIAYAVLSSGGIFGMGAKLLAIPWSALTLDAAQKRFVLSVTREQLENAPGFDKDHWPAMADRGWAAAVHDHYDAKPYWMDAQNSGSDLRASATGEMPPRY